MFINIDSEFNSVGFINDGESQKEIRNRQKCILK